MEREDRKTEVEIRNRPSRTSNHVGYGADLDVDERDGHDADYGDHDVDGDVDLHGEEVLGGGLSLLLPLFCCLPPSIIII